MGSSVQQIWLLCDHDDVFWNPRISGIFALKLESAKQSEGILKAGTSVCFNGSLYLFVWDNKLKFASSKPEEKISSAESGDEFINHWRSVLDHMYPVSNLSTRVNEIIASGLKIGNLLRYNRNHKNKKKGQSKNDWRFNLFINPEKFQKLWWLLFTNVWANKWIEARTELNRTIIH